MCKKFFLEIFLVAKEEHERRGGFIYYSCIGAHVTKTRDYTGIQMYDRVIYINKSVSLASVLK